jgi:hypothetical protein
VFPEEAKELARRMGLKEGAVQILELKKVKDKGANVQDEWIEQAGTVRGRIDPVGSGHQVDRFGEGLREATTHVVSMDPDTRVTVADRLEIEGKVWTITGDEIVTEGSSKMVQVAEL